MAVRPISRRWGCPVALRRVRRSQPSRSSSEGPLVVLKLDLYCFLDIGGRPEVVAFAGEEEEGAGAPGCLQAGCEQSRLGGGCDRVGCSVDEQDGLVDAGRVVQDGASAVLVGGFGPGADEAVGMPGLESGGGAPPRRRVDDGGGRGGGGERAVGFEQCA